MEQGSGALLLQQPHPCNMSHAPHAYPTVAAVNADASMMTSDEPKEVTAVPPYDDTFRLLSPDTSTQSSDCHVLLTIFRILRSSREVPRPLMVTSNWIVKCDGIISEATRWWTASSRGPKVSTEHAVVQSTADVGNYLLRRAP
jgi:hypothetical protein